MTNHYQPTIVPRELLNDLAAEVPLPTQPQHKPTSNTRAFDVNAFIRRSNLDVSEPELWNGQQGSGTRWVFITSPLCEHHDGAAFILQHASGAITAQCHHNTCSWTWADLRAKYEPMREVAKTKPQIVSGVPDELPVVYLPGASVPIIESAQHLGRLLGATGRYYIRGGVPVVLEHDDDGDPVLVLLKPAMLASALEHVARLGRQTENGPIPATCSEAAAKLILHAEPFQTGLPLIRVMTRCPVLVLRGDRLEQIVGYDADTGIMAGGEPAEDIDLTGARTLLDELIADFDFASASDRSRALAALVTPALVFAGLLPGRPPLDLGEADDSQSGKGYRNKLTAALYRQNVVAITQRRGGVGGLEESFNGALIRGANFIAIDNVRGPIDSPALESFLTEDSYMARIPYQADVQIDTRRHVVMLTSNKAEITPDLSNRSSCVRILKRTAGYRYATYLEGDVLDHLRAQQPGYLGAVFAVVRAWHEAGRPRTAESRHDFRPWAQTLDWIVQELLGGVPLLDGHRETQQRMTTPALNWLRDVA